VQQNGYNFGTREVVMKIWDLWPLSVKMKLLMSTHLWQAAPHIDFIHNSAQLTAFSGQAGDW